jgi:hypothetical protein
MFICIGGCFKKGNIDDVQSGEISFLLKVDGACIAYSKSQKIQDWIEECGSTA